MAELDLALSLESLKSAIVTHWVSFATSSILVYVFTRCIYLLHLHPAAKFPGPKFAAVSNIPYAYHWIRGRWPWAVESMIKKYGNVVRVAPNEIAFMTPEATLDIYNTAVKGHETFLKTDLMDFGMGDKGFIWESDPAKRREVAKKLLPAFSTKAIKAKEPTVHKYIDLFVNKMEELGCKGDGIEINEWLRWFAMDLSTDLAYNREMHHMRDAQSSEFLKSLLNTNLFGTVSQVLKKFPLLSLFSVFFVSPKVLLSFLRVLKLNSEEIQKRIDNRGNTKHPDFVDFMLPPHATPPTTKKQKVHLEQVAFQLFIAGYDPIQITLNSVIFFLLKEPETYAKLVKEIREAFQDYNDINSDSLVGLKFLHACVQEILRVHVAGVSGLPRISPGAMVDGVYVPQGVVCQISTFSAARNPSYFRDSTEFRPQRWLPLDHLGYDSRYAKDNLKSFFPFGVGPRMCTGREIAWQQTKLFLAKVLWSFDLEGVRGLDKEFDEDFRVHVMWYRPELWVRFVPVERVSSG